MTYRYLVVSDTNNIIDYIFASTKYKYIRGASLLLDYLNTNKAEALVAHYSGKLLSAGGGELRVLFEKLEQAAQFEQALQKLYIEQTDEVTLTSALVERQEGEKMATWLERSEEALRYAEYTKGKKQLHMLTLAPIMKRCEVCHNRAAEKIPNVADFQLTEKTCRSCGAKLKELQTVKSAARARNLTAQRSNITDLYEQLQRKNLADQNWVTALEDLFEGEGSAKKIGFIYADGKGIGKLFKNIVDETALSDEQFIRAYTDKSFAVRNSLIQATIRTHEKLKATGFQQVVVDYALLGGDDLAAAMPGNIALLYANYLAKFFEQETQKAFGEPYYLSVGVVIAKNKFPIHKLFDLSYELMANAKYSHTKGVVDFEYLLDSNVQSIEVKRSDTKVGNSSRRLHLQGFKVGEGQRYAFENMYKQAVALKNSNFPSSKIKAIYHITTEQNEATLNFVWREWLSRLDSKHTKILFDLDPKLRETPFSIDVEGEHYTPMRKLFELYDLVEQEVKLS